MLIDCKMLFMIRILFFGWVFLLIAGCENKHIENTKRLVLINSYSWDNKLSATDSIYLDQEIKNDTVSFIYTNSEADTLMFSFFKPANHDSSIMLFGFNCPLVAHKTFEVMGRKLKVLKYEYDRPNSWDEEADFFYQHDYGLLVGYSVGWPKLAFTMDYDSISKILNDSIINDRSGFYSGYFPPLPDSIKIEDILNIVDED